MNNTLYMTYIFNYFKKNSDKMNGQNCVRKIMSALRIERRE